MKILWFFIPHFVSECILQRYKRLSFHHHLVIAMIVIEHIGREVETVPVLKATVLAKVLHNLLFARTGF